MVTVTITSYEIAIEESRRFWKNDVYIVYIIHVNLKANIWSFRVGSSSSSMDHGDLVYKVDSLVQSSLSSSLVLTLIQDFFL